MLQLRKQEFIEASRMVGASTPRIVRTHMLPHLVGPIAVYFAIICRGEHRPRVGDLVPEHRRAAPGSELGEHARDELGALLHRRPAGHPSGIITSAWTTFLPAAAIALTVLCLALIGEGVREAFDPGSRSKAVRL